MPARTAHAPAPPTYSPHAKPMHRCALQDEHLKRIPDLSRLAKRFQRGTASLQDVVRLYQVALRLPSLVATLERHDTAEVLQTTYAAPLKVRGSLDWWHWVTADPWLTRGGLPATWRRLPAQRAMADLAKFQQMVETTIDLKAVENHEFMIKADFDERLQGSPRPTLRDWRAPFKQSDTGVCAYCWRNEQTCGSPCRRS